MPWLVRDDEVLASLEVASSFAARARGLLGRDGIDGALLLGPTRSLHSIGMRFDLDVAWCDGGVDDDLVVVATTRLRRWRVTRPRLRARRMIEAEAGAFSRWRLAPGDRLDVR